jgi:hypothetical protein
MTTLNHHFLAQRCVQRALLFALMALGLPALANLSLPIYDPYPTNYANNARLRDVATYDAGNSSGNGSNITNSWTAGLTYGGLATSNNTGGLIANGVPSSGRDAGIQISPPVPFSVATNTLYCSFLLKIQTAPSGTNLIALFSGSTGGGNTPVAGVYLDAANKLWISKSSATPQTNTPNALTIGDTHLIVFRYKYSATDPDEVALWVDPGSLAAAENAVPAATITTTNGSDAASAAAFDWAHRTTANISASGVKYYDELRIATNWAAVTPSDCTPPTSYAITGGGVYCSGGTGVSIGLATSDTGINYQLKLNGTPTGSAVAGTGSPLDFGLQTAGGSYTVTASNTATACIGQMTGNAVVIVNTAPAISGGPSNMVACTGSTANFTVSATGTALTYQWQSNTGSGFNDIVGATASGYTTATLSPTDDGTQFRCIVSGTCLPSATSAVATVSVSSGVSINSNPADKTVSVGSSPTFTVGATGPGLTYQWQVSTDNGGTYNNVTTGSGGTTASYTTAPLALTDSGSKFQCVVGASCGSPSNAGPATVTVNNAVYRSLASGPWNLLGTWEQSYDSGSTWVSATTSPNAANTSAITVRSGHTVTVTNAQTVDDLAIEPNGEVDASGAMLTIADGTAATDCDVSGTLQVASAASGALSVTAGAGLKFENGGHFIWNNSATVAVPTATWSDGSLCEIQNGSTTTPTGLGQSFYDFYWNKTNSGSVSLNATLTTVRHDLRMRGSADSANSVRFLNAAGTCDLRVGNNVVFDSGFITLSGGSAANTILNIYVGADLIINPGATMDSRTSGAGSSANVLFTNTASSQAFSNTGAITHTGSGGGCPINWNVGTNVTLTMAGNIVMLSANGGTRDSVTVDGTLIMGANLITGAGNLFLDPTGTLSGNSTNQLTVGLNNTVYGGALNLGTVPTLAAGQSFKLFDSLAYSGAFSSIIPSAPPGGSLVWDTTTLTNNGTLTAANPGSSPATNPTNIVVTASGNSLTLSWPADHIGWMLETQTNGFLGSWTSVTGSTATNQITIPIDPVVPDAFYRLRLTLP